MQIRALLIFLFLAGTGILLIAQSAQLFFQRKELGKEMVKTSEQVERLAEENKELKEKIEYLSRPENLEKELRKLNYKAVGEKLLILIND